MIYSTFLEHVLVELPRRYGRKSKMPQLPSSEQVTPLRGGVTKRQRRSPRPSRKGKAISRRVGGCRGGEGGGRRESLLPDDGWNGFNFSPDPQPVDADPVLQPVQPEPEPKARWLREYAGLLGGFCRNRTVIPISLDEEGTTSSSGQRCFAVADFQVKRNRQGQEELKGISVCM